MLKDFTVGQYYPVDSSVHRLDPRTKLFLSVIAAITLFSRDSWAGFLVWSAIFLVALHFSRLPVKLVLRNLRPFLWLFVVVVGIQLYYTPASGDSWRLFGSVVVDRQAVNFALLHSCRLALFILLSALLTLSTSPVEIADALGRLLAPLRFLKVPVHEFALMISIAIRFIPTILQEADRIRKAQLCRGADFSGSFLRRIQHLVPMTVPLFLSTFQRAEALAIAMEARGYDLSQPRTNYIEMTLSALDVGLLATGSLLTGVLFFV